MTRWLERWWSLPIFLAACVYSLSCATIGWNLPILECHSFRQTQTAITALFQLGHGPQLAYETPLFGPPWSIPMEFPTYQWLVSLASTMLGTPLDQTGRAISLLLFWLMLIPAYQALGIFRLTPEHRLVVLTLLVVSPFYIFWSRTFMIESTALAFSVAFLALAAAALTTASRWQLGVAIVCGALAAVTKITTFSTFLGAFLLLVLWRHWQGSRNWAAGLRGAGMAGLIAGPAVLVGVAWTHFADAIKTRNPLGAHLTSSALNSWNFGTLQQRLSPGTWQGIVARLTDIESHAGVYLLAIVALIVARRRWREAALCLGLFVVAVLSFTNLHGHWYYAYANLIFVIVAVGLSIVGLLEQGGWQRAAGMLLLALTVGVSGWRFQSLHARLQLNADPRLLHIAESVRRLTGPDEVILVLGDDWSSRVPYYAQRRALMVAEWAEEPQLSQALDNLASCHVGALVAFNSTGSPGWNPAQDPTVAGYLRRFGLSSVASLADSSAQIFPTAERAGPYEVLRDVLRDAPGQSPDDAVSKLTQAIESAPGETALYSARAKYHLRQGEYDAALADCDRAAELGPREFEFQLDRARFCLAMRGGREESSVQAPLLEKALASADRAVALAPNQPSAYKLRSMVFSAMKMTDLAAQDAATADSWLHPGPMLNGWGNLVPPAKVTPPGSR